ncbi:STAS domain-containing protein [Kitasatospora sp. NPDC093679]|uniref:STAS domain-containing protein n=1 Tax=Kitasatospora sp. NPDC093679 TaxID=3154983 RepID=UPI00342F0CC5
MADELKTGVELVGAVAVCTLAGDLHRDTEDEVRAAVSEALGLLPQVLAVDLHGVELFTSSALNALLQAREAASDRAVPVVLISPPGGVRRVLEVTGAAELFAVCASVREAAGYARPPRSPGA